MATGFARGAFARGKRIAFGDGKRLIWGPWCKEAFKNNPNIADRADLPNIEWVHYYKGHRGYNAGDYYRRRWIWNYDFVAPRGEIYFSLKEHAWLNPAPGTVLLEPNVPWHKSVAVNKDWGALRWQLLAAKLKSAGWRVRQTSYGKVRLESAEAVPCTSFRHAAAILAGCDLAIVPEGGLHHAAAAMHKRAIVIFGGFIPPEVTGYRGHINLTGGAEACGKWDRCEHCRKALDNIEVEQVYAMANTELHQKNSTASAGIGGVR